MRAGTRRATTIALGIVAGLLAVITIALLLLTQTNWGRDRVSAFGIGQLAKQINGKLTVEDVRGNLLSGATLVNVTLTDSAGRPFLSADTLRMRYSLASLYSKQLVFRNVRLVGATIVLDKRPGEKWNFERIFPTDTLHRKKGRGFGSWLRLEDVTIRRGTLVMRTPWQPAAELEGAARQAAIRKALSPANRDWVVPVEGGYQRIIEVLAMHGFIPLIRLADPDSATRVIRIDRMRAVALPFRPPAAHVRDLRGSLVLGSDSMWFRDMHVRMPGSNMAVNGAYPTNGDGVRMEIGARPFTFADLRWLDPTFPAGGGRMDLALNRHADQTRAIASNMDVRAEGAHVLGKVDLLLGPHFRMGPSDVRYSGVGTALVRRYIPQAPLEVPGTLAGHMRLAGTPARMNVNGWTTYDERSGPTSRIVANGVVGSGGGAFVARGLRLRFEPLYLSLVRGYSADFPLRGRIEGSATLTGSSRSGFDLVADLVDTDPRAGRSHVLARGRLTPRDGITARNLRLTFRPLQLALVEPFTGDLPYGGTLTGTATLTGSSRSYFDLNTELTHRDPKLGRSHFAANGRIRLAGGPATSGLRLRMDPLQVGMLRPFVPNLPVDGTLTGRTTITMASGEPRIALTDMNVEHRGSTGYSNLMGDARLAWGRRSFFDVDVRAPALSLATVGRFAPSAGLRGSASGSISARGTLAEVRLAADLDIAGGGAIRTRGTLASSGGVLRYDLTNQLTAFNAAAVTSRLPSSNLTGSVYARGVGTNPATASAFVDANLLNLGVGGQVFDTTRVVARVANGLANVERGHVRLGSAVADVWGSFGLVEGRSGILRYVLRVDSLSQFATFVPRDTGMVVARPALQAARVAEARADSTTIARETEVQRAAVGYPPEPTLRVDTIPPMPRDSVAGSLWAQGVLVGNIHRFDAQGTARAENLLASGTYLGRGRASYTLQGFGSPSAKVDVDASVQTLRTGGFAFDSARAKVAYAGLRSRGSGTAEVALFQDPDRDYRATSAFTLALDRRELRLQTLAMRFDTTHWNATHPATIRWGGAGIEVDELELRNASGGLVYADGLLPTEGVADLRLQVRDLQVGDITALLQDSVSTRGIVDLDARIRGSTASPRMEGTFAVDSGVYRGTVIPDVRGNFDYAGNRLTTHTELFRDSLRLAVADATLPAQLSLSGQRGFRLLRTQPLTARILADSLPLEALPSFTTAVSDVRGRIRGDATVTGTIDDPRLGGVFDLDLGSLRVNATGVRMTEIVGRVRLEGDRAVVDSIVAHAGGPIRVTGTVDIASLARPGFDLTVVAKGATLIDNKHGSVDADATLAIQGPFSALNVTGDVFVTNGVFWAPESKTRRVTNLDDPTVAGMLDSTTVAEGVLPHRSELLKNLTVDVGLRIARDTWVRNTQANLEIYTPDDAGAVRVHMDNRTGSLTLLGVINVDRGEYTYAGRLFQMTTGAVTFMGNAPVDPLLQLTALYNVERRGRDPLAIQIHLDGTMTRPRVSLESNAQPPLAQSDLLSYLAFGRPASSLLSLQQTGGVQQGSGAEVLGALAQQQLGSLALGAGVQDLVSSLQRRGTRGGLDVFRVHPGELPAEFAFQNYFSNLVRGTEFEAGKYLTPRFFAVVRGRPATGVFPGLSLEYRAPSGFVWTTTWEPRYLPVEPSLVTDVNGTEARSFGTFLLWEKRF